MSQPEVFNPNNPNNNPSIAEGLKHYKAGDYRQAIQTWQQLVDNHTQAPIDRVVACHHVGSAYGKLCEWSHQAAANEAALVLLKSSASRINPQHVEFYMLKITAGLYESGAREWNEQEFTRVVQAMIATGAYDAPGRAEYLAVALSDLGRTSEAIGVLRELFAANTSQMASNQLERAMALLEQLSNHAS